MRRGVVDQWVAVMCDISASIFVRFFNQFVMYNSTSISPEIDSLFRVYPQQILSLDDSSPLLGPEPSIPQGFGGTEAGSSFLRAEGTNLITDLDFDLIYRWNRRNVDERMLFGGCRHCHRHLRRLALQIQRS